jgi:hypothetical protein
MGAKTPEIERRFLFQYGRPYVRQGRVDGNSKSKRDAVFSLFIYLFIYLLIYLFVILLKALLSTEITLR